MVLVLACVDLGDAQAIWCNAVHGTELQLRKCYSLPIQSEMFKQLVIIREQTCLDMFEITENQTGQ